MSKQKQIRAEDLPYRPCVGIMLINSEGLVWVGNRIQEVDTGSPLTWQMPQGGIDEGEDAAQAAFRELKEEAGYGARELTVLRALTLAPSYMSHETSLVLARDLYPERLPGDEPEPPEVVPWRLDRLHELILREDFSEGRSIAALFIAREWMRTQ